MYDYPEERYKFTFYVNGVGKTIKGVQLTGNDYFEQLEAAKKYASKLASEWDSPVNVIEEWDYFKELVHISYP
jgi:hypothetical protein